jgi:excisionase family DNA binding protein
MAMPEVSDVAPEAQFVGVETAHTVTGLSTTTLYTQLNNGTIASVRFGGRRLIPVEELDRFVNELRSQVK